MKTRRLGSSNLEVSVVGLGTNNFGMRLDLEATRAVIDKAIEVGVTLIDTADTYGDTKSEAFIGEVLGARRSQVVLATKFGMRRDAPPTASRAYVMEAAEASLRRLQTDYIDLFQQHQFDPQTPQEETLRALEDLIAQGKVRHVGNSNFSGAQIEAADTLAVEQSLPRFISCQDAYSLADRRIEAEILPIIRDRQIGLLPFHPLANGLFTGKYQKGAAPPKGARLSESRAGERYFTGSNLNLLEAVSAFARDRGHTVLELAFAWLLSEPMLASVIAGASNPAQMADNAKAAEWELSPADVAELRLILDSSARLAG